MKETYTTLRSIPEAVSELERTLMPVDPSAVLFFASTHYEPEALAAAMRNAFPTSEVFGCTTAGEISRGRILENSIVAMAFSREELPNIHVEVVENVSRDTVHKVDDALYHTGAVLGRQVITLDPMRYAGFVLVDGLSEAEEDVIERLGDLAEIAYVGGSAGDDLKFSATYLFARGKAYRDAALIVTFESTMPFGVEKTQSFRPLGKTLVATRVSESGRKVLTFNDEPAVEAYAKAVGKSIDELPQAFLDHPLGLMAGEEPYVRSPKRVEEDGLAFYCHIHEGMELQVLEGTDIVEGTHEALRTQVGDPEQIAGLVNFNCILRTLELKALGETEEYGKLFDGFPTVGFSSYGEAYLGHINQTATMLVFKKAA